MALATTVCFCAKWQSEFNKNNTKQDIFHSENGDIQCDFMNISGTDTYFWGDKFGAINKYFDQQIFRSIRCVDDVHPAR